MIKWEDINKRYEISRVVRMFLLDSKKGEIAFNEIDEYVIKVTESYSNYKIDGFDSIDRLNNLIINS